MRDWLTGHCQIPSIRLDTAGKKFKNPIQMTKMNKTKLFIHLNCIWQTRNTTTTKIQISSLLCN